VGAVAALALVIAWTFLIMAYTGASAGFSRNGDV
ncbi:MAG: hypothetical protein RLZZ104_85, partial [Pseudomonadota bacterium]